MKEFYLKKKKANGLGEKVVVAQWHKPLILTLLRGSGDIQANLIYKANFRPAELQGDPIFKTN